MIESLAEISVVLISKRNRIMIFFIIGMVVSMLMLCKCKHKNVNQQEILSLFAYALLRLLHEYWDF